MKIFVFIQSDKNKISNISLEALKGAQEILSNTGGSISAITFNSDHINTLEKFDISEVLYINNPALDVYSPLEYIKTLEQIFSKETPDLIIFGHTYEARDWVPRLSARLDIPFISDCIGIKFDDNLKFVRSQYQGKLNADISVNVDNFILSFQSGAFRSDMLKQGTATHRELTLDIGNIENIIRPSKKFQESESSVDLTQAEIIVSIGRGIGKEENIITARELASALGGELASSRPVVDSGWLESYHQIGSSGQTVSPKLYFALGISGAIQHVVGMKAAKNILVINKDVNAPIFEIADYGVVGDIFEIIPKLTELLKTN
tara:strand:- start:1051 stop:2007 length:957 start_codon:yes stop_codon:yes gene_type:complete